MRFYKGISFPWRRPRGRARGTYRMSLAAYQARLRNLVHVPRQRTYAETQRLQIEIALATHRGESTRSLAKRLRCSHVHCWRVARRYRSGLLPLLPRDEQGLVALRESLSSAAAPRQVVP